MKKALIAAVGLFSLFALLLTATPAHAALCFICTSGSSNGCKQCRARGGKDTQKARKVCKNLGCKIGGTTSCSSAANVKKCSAASWGRTSISSEYYLW